MNRSHQSFLQQNGSTLLEKEAEICGFKTYQFRSSNGYGKTSILNLDRAQRSHSRIICIITILNMLCCLRILL